jgi:histidine triad (HIT) family protein
MSRLANCTQQNIGTLGHLVYVAASLARQFGCENGYRLVINDGNHGGQTG